MIYLEIIGKDGVRYEIFQAMCIPFFVAMELAILEPFMKVILSFLRKGEYLDGIYTIKVVGPKVFLYIDTNLDFETIVDTLKNSIKAQGGLAYVYEFYTIYREKIDYNAYISAKVKDTMRYFNTKQKDLSNQELEDFLKSNNIKGKD